MSRPIERLPTRRHSNEPKEAMNCKSCRKRKIKCNRLRPSCEACQVFKCACIYDAIPKKRGPKTDVLEALLKRVNGLEKQLKDDHSASSPEQSESANSIPESSEAPQEKTNHKSFRARTKSVPVPVHTQHPSPRPQLPAPGSQITLPNDPNSFAFHDLLIDTYFARIHAKPFYILDEGATRERLRDGILPHFLVNAIHAVSMRYVPHLNEGYYLTTRTSEELARQSRIGIDVDEPNIDHLQALLLLSVAYHQNGKGKRSYMMLSHAVGMAFALNLHRELPTQLQIVPPEREGRRRLFWTVYLMDRFTASGSTRPSLILDGAIHLRLPARQVPGMQHPAEGDFFPSGSTSLFASGIPNTRPDAGKMLIEMVRILGITNRYLADGGVQGDSHFPWHAQSTLSHIRSDLDLWAANSQEMFGAVESLFNYPDPSALLLSKLIHHLVHCLIYRPFLPIDLAELSGTGQNQSWQIEATSICFAHANAIVEIVEVGKNISTIDWPAFVSYCICTAGSVHVHGAHYVSFQDENVYHRSAEFLSREMSQLYELRATSINAEHQRSTLQLLYVSHAQLVKSLATSPMRFSPVFQMEDFWSRYSSVRIDGSYIPFTDITVDAALPIPLRPDATDFAKDSNAGHTSTMEANAPYQTGVLSGSGDPRPDPGSDASRDPTKLGIGSLFSSMDANSMSQPGDISLAHEMPLRRGPASTTRPLPLNAETENGVVQYGNNPMLAQGVPSPGFSFTPLVRTPMAEYQGVAQSSLGQHTEHVSPDASSAKTSMDLEQDPFLSLLEQLAENDSMGLNGPNDFDFFYND